MIESGKKIRYAFVSVLMLAGFCSAANPVELFIAGGAVMYPILLLSIVSWGITIERILVIFLQKRKLKPAKFIDAFEESMKKNGGDKDAVADEMLEFLKTKTGVYVEIMTTTLTKFKEGREKNLKDLDLRQWIQASAESKAAMELPLLESHLIALAVISNVATLMGLFGTVIGMISSFTAMANSPGGVKADEMAGGIAIALVATAGGLTVAVPSLILYNWIKSHVENFVLQIDETVTGVIDTLVS